jgi:methanogenic corrinoid protein MtbC1/DNA-binding XRE family transcriptional regulator
MNTFGLQLKKIRKERGLRQKDLAELFDVAQSTIANYEQGIRFPDEEMLRKLADFFGVSTDYLLGRTEFPAPLPLDSSASRDSVDSDDPFVKKFVDLVLETKADEAENLIMEKLRKRTDIVKVYMKILQPSLYYIGSLWENGKIDVSEEHYFSQVVQNIMARAMSNANGINGEPVFIGLSVSGEEHNIGIRMISDVLAAHGWKTLYLGDNLPTNSVLRAIKDHEADVLGISATMPAHVKNVTELIQAVRNESRLKPVRIAVGGYVFNQSPELWRNVGADMYAENAEQVLAVLSS